MTRQVFRRVRKEGIAQRVLWGAARDVAAQRLREEDADIGGGLYKKQIEYAQPGRVGVYRMILACRPDSIERVLLAFMFRPHARERLSIDGQEALARAAGAVLSAKESQVAKLLEWGYLLEVRRS